MTAVAPHSANASAVAPERGLRSLVRHPGLRKLALVRLLAALGDGAFQGALANVVLFDPTRNTRPADIAAGFAVLLLPYSLIGPFAGALLDRWSRRQVLVWSNVLRAFVVGVLAILLLSGTPLWALLVVALLVVGVGRFVGSGLSASLPHVVPTTSLVGANSLTTTLGSIATLTGGGYAIGLRSAVGPSHLGTAGVTASVALFFLAASLVARRFRRDALGPDETDEPPQPLLAILEGFTAGFRYAIHHVTVWLNIAMVMVVRLCVGLSTMVVLLLFRNHFTGHHGIMRGGLGGVSEVLAAAGLGLFLGAVTTAPMVHWLGRTRWVVILLAFAAVVVLGVGAQFNQVSTLITALLLALVYQSTKVCADAVVQADSDDAHIGRVFALYDTASNVFYVCGFVIAATFVPNSGLSYPVVFLAAGLFLATSMGYGMVMRGRRHLHSHIL